MKGLKTMSAQNNQPFLYCQRQTKKDDVILYRLISGSSLHELTTHGLGNASSITVPQSMSDLILPYKGDINELFATPPTGLSVVCTKLRDILLMIFPKDRALELNTMIIFILSTYIHQEFSSL